MDSGKAAGGGQSLSEEGGSAGRGSRLNVELLRKVRDAIADEANAVGFDMVMWGWDCQDGCATAACIAGHVACQAGLGLTPKNVRRAPELLGIDGGTANYVFYGEWAREGGYAKGLDMITRDDAIAYLDRCIDAGEIVR